jgi:uncharacterized phage protein (predicted DNA packaging)
MPNIVTLEEAKLFMRVDADDEDLTIETLIAAATEAALAYADGIVPTDSMEYPARVKLSILTHVAQAFGNRENGADAPASTMRLMQPLRSLEV